MNVLELILIQCLFLDLLLLSGVYAGCFQSKHGDEAGAHHGGHHGRHRGHLSPQAEQNPSTIIYALPPPPEGSTQPIQQTPHQVEEEAEAHPVPWHLEAQQHPSRRHRLPTPPPGTSQPPQQNPPRVEGRSPRHDDQNQELQWQQGGGLTMHEWQPLPLPPNPDGINIKCLKSKQTN
uniref:Candidate secreted effector n=1 Tax=Meloidogyne incognita TaxID=6306 RepID=A0A914LHT4_MELIC